MNQLKYLESKKLSKYDKDLNKFYNYTIKKEKIINNISDDLYNRLINIKKEKEYNLDKINNNLLNLNKYKYINILDNKINIDILFYGIIYCLDSNISFLDIEVFLKELKTYIIYNVSNLEFDNKNKIINNLEKEDNINHLVLVFLSYYFNINIFIIRYNNFLKIISDENNKNILLIKKNNNYYPVYNKINNTFFINIDEIEEKFKNYDNYDFDYLRSISYYKIDELRKICKLFNIKLENDKGKKKIKKELYDELINKI